MVDTHTKSGKAAFAGALAAVVVGLCVLVGWLFDLEFLKRIAPELVAMNPATAVAFILAGASLALFLQSPPGGDQKSRALIPTARLCALVVTLIGLAKLTDILFGSDLSVDQWLFASNLADGLRPPNRIAPNTALNFLLLGSALLFVDVKRRSVRLCVEFSVVLVGLGSLLAVLAYGYDIQSLYGLGAFLPMALHTAITFSVLVVALLLSHTDSGLLAVFAGDNAGGTMARRLLPAAVLVPAVLGWLTRQGEVTGLYHGGFGVAAFAVGNILVFTFLVCSSARELFSADLVRKNAEVALQESEARTRLLVKSSNIGLWDWNLVTNQVFFSPEWKNQLGYAETELPSRFEEWESRLHPEDREPTLAAVKDYVEGRLEKFEVEFRLRHKEGSWRWMLTRASLTRDAIGRPVRIRGCHIDITERKRSEAELEKTHGELVKASHYAGMAEVATGILHNVGNVLNSVNVASSCIADSIRKSKAANLGRVVGLLREHEADMGDFLTVNPQGKQIPGYLAELAEHLVGEQTAALKELAHLQKNIEHIKDITAMQQGFARVSGATELLSVADLVEDALKMNASALARHDIVVGREFQEVPLLKVEKHQVLLILVNLMRNAMEACDEANPLEKQITVRVTRGNDGVRIAVTDNGIGIPAENLTRLFAHGFTTKQSGHGFGLHSAALAAKKMGGALTVHSDGPGLGATFTLELPYSTRIR